MAALSSFIEDHRLHPPQSQGVFYDRHRTRRDPEDRKEDNAIDAQLQERRHAVRTARNSGNNSAIASSTSFAGHRRVGPDGITASPKLRQLLAERKAIVTPSAVDATACKRRSRCVSARRNDGIAASPTIAQ